MEGVGAGAFLRHGKERFWVEKAVRDVVSEALVSMALLEAMSEGLKARQGISDGLSVKENLARAHPTFLCCLSGTLHLRLGHRQ